MAETLSHRDIGVEPDGGAPTGVSRWQKVVGVFGLVVVLWVGDRMYDVVSFDGNFGGGSGGQQEPVQPQETDADGGGRTPGPPEGGHG